MNRSLKLSILVALAMSSTQALALGLGQIHVKSALDKPLVAEIPLRTDYPGEADDLTVSLASADQFAQAGLDRMSLSVQLNFKVTTNAAGQKIILVTSDQPVRESYLDFLIQVSWPRGQLLREYTVLLDPPGSVATARLQGAVAPSPARQPSPAPAPAPAAPPPAAAKPPKPAVAASHKMASKPAAKPKPPAPAPAPAPAPQAQSGNYGPVQSGQTLWGIARKQRPEGVSVNQMMLALKSANPDAFYKDNINALKRGAVLRIPTRDEAMAQTMAAATAEVLRQDQSWSARAPSRPTMVASAGHGTSAKPGNPAPTPSGAHARRSGNKLRLVPPSNAGESTGAQAGVAGGSNKVTVDQLHDEVARAKEALSSSKQQTADLQAHLKSLKDIQDKNDRLMSLKNAEIAALQNKLAAAGKPASGASSAAPSMSGSMAAGASSVAMATTAAMPAAASTAAAAANKPPVVAKPAATPPAAHAVRHASEAPWYGPLWVKIAAAGALIVLLLLFLRSKRKPKASPMAGSGASLADQFGDSPFGGAEEDEHHQPDQDEDELLHELAQNPEDVGLHLELVSLYYARRDVDRFEAAAEAMRTHISDPQQPEWQDVVAMGEELSPDHPLFAADEGAYAPDVPEHAGAQGGDDDYTYPPASHAEPTDTHADSEEDLEAAAESGHDYDFDLTSEAPRSPEAPSEDDFDALPPLEDETPEAPPAHPADEAPAAPEVSLSDGPDLELDEPPHAGQPAHAAADEDAHEESGASPASGMAGDAVDTKIDLARAYMDMGDPEGARAMLEEVMHEGTQAQCDTAQKLLDELDDA